MTGPAEPDPVAVAAVARTWDGRAAGYDRHYRAHSDAGRDPWRELYRRAIAALLEPAEQPRTILDIGTGTGFVATLLAELGHDVTGIDVSARMLDRAAAEARRRGVRVRWRHCDGHDPAAIGSRFDLITCRHVLWTMPAPAAALLAWVSVLRPGGALLVADGLWHTPSQLLRRPQLVPGAARDYLAMGRSLPYWRGLTEDRVHRLLAAAGLRRPQSFGHLLPAHRHRDSRGFFVIGAVREE